MIRRAVEPALQEHGDGVWRENDFPTSDLRPPPTPSCCRAWGIVSRFPTVHSVVHHKPNMIKTAKSEVPSSHCAPRRCWPGCRCPDGFTSWRFCPVISHALSQEPQATWAFHQCSLALFGSSSVNPEEKLSPRPTASDFQSASVPSEVSLCQWAPWTRVSGRVASVCRRARVCVYPCPPARLSVTACDRSLARSHGERMQLA